jgi:hypothetical protein
LNFWSWGGLEETAVAEVVLYDDVYWLALWIELKGATVDRSHDKPNLCCVGGTGEMSIYLFDQLSITSMRLYLFHIRLIKADKSVKDKITRRIIIITSCKIH